MGKSEQTEELEQKALAALQGQSSADLGRWSEKKLADRLRKKRLGIPLEERDDRPSIAWTLREISKLILSPWAAAGHPWAAVAPDAPRMHREMGERVYEFFGDMTSTRDGLIVLGGLDYQRSVSIGRVTQMLDEVRWFIDGRLAIAWNVGQHQHAIAQWYENQNESALKADLAACLRWHPGAPMNFVCEQFVQNTFGETAIMGSRVLSADPCTVWGALRPNVKSNDDELAIVAALNTLHHFTARV